jgi:hypothetical protein
MIGLKVISATADGASPNRSFFKMNLPAIHEAKPKVSAAKSASSCSTSDSLSTSTVSSSSHSGSALASTSLALSTSSSASHLAFDYNAKIHLQLRRGIYISFPTHPIF